MTIGVAVNKKALVIFRDDHIGDRIGAIFLGLEDGEREVARRVREYLGGKARILKIELGIAPAQYNAANCAVHTQP